MPAPIRKAVAADHEAVARLNRQVQDQHHEAYPSVFRPAGPDTLTATAFADLLATPDMEVLVAVDGSEIVGYVTARLVQRPDTPYTYGQRVLYIDQICVDRAARRGGHGRRLLDAALDFADRLGIARVELDTWAANTGARAFFESVGFQAHDIRMSLERPARPSTTGAAGTEDRDRAAQPSPPAGHSSRQDPGA